MRPQITPEQRAKVADFQRKHRIGLLALLFTDMVGSTKLKQELGDQKAVALIQQHHAVVREILSGFKEGEEIETAGDSFLIVFAKPSDAVKFGLLLQSRLRRQFQESGQSVQDRIGIHIGEVIIAEGPDQAKDLYGIQVDVCARVMSLAQGGQTLLTRSAFDNARQVLKGQELEAVGALLWMNHGSYELKGLDEPVEICEVGEADKAPLSPPADTDKAKRQHLIEGEPVLGWRPAVDQQVPGTHWVLREKLGEGGFGEVWLGQHQTLKRLRVFKFCFRADRVRSLKREVTLFRLLKERVGQHPNIVGIEEVFFDEPPFYIAMDYAEGQDLRTWCEARAGAPNVPLETKLEIVAQVAEALEAAHAAGVIHRDVKPSNILLTQTSTPNAQPTAKLTDFGIGQVVSQEYLAGVTRAGFTQTMLASGSSSQAGTHLYMAPELLAGKPASIGSDIYSLGVVLYQLLVGDFTLPVTTDWTKRVDDSLLREDLQRCFAGDPAARFERAQHLADSLRSLEKRKAALARQTAALDALAQLHAAAVSRRPGSLVIQLTKAMTCFTVIALAVCFVGLLTFEAIRIPKLFRTRTILESGLCVVNLKRIEEAKRQWALDHQKPAGSPVDSRAVLAYIKGAAPRCPSGSSYSFNEVGTEPMCSLGIMAHDLRRLDPAFPLPGLNPVSPPKALVGFFKYVLLGYIFLTVSTATILLARARRAGHARPESIHRGQEDSGGIRLADVAAFTRQLATMLNAGLATGPSLRALGGQMSNRTMRAAVQDLRARVEQGDSFAMAVRTQPKLFNPVYCCLVSFGERTGLLPDVLSQLAAYLEDAQNAVRLRQRAKSALLYPAVLACILYGLTAFVLVKVVPVFGDVFSGFGAQLPAPTKTLIEWSVWIQRNFLLLLLGMFAVYYLWRKFIKTDSGREFWDRTRIQLPVFGPVALKMALARFTRTLALLFRNRVPAMEVLAIAAGSSGNLAVEKAIRAAASAQGQGASLSTALSKQPLFPCLLVRLLVAGEQTGKTEVMLERITALLDEEVESTLNGLASLIEPLFLLLVLMVMGIIALCLLLPSFKVSEVLF